MATTNSALVVVEPKRGLALRTGAAGLQPRVSKECRKSRWTMSRLHNKLGHKSPPTQDKAPLNSSRKTLRHHVSNANPQPSTSRPTNSQGSRVHQLQEPSTPHAPIAKLSLLASALVKGGSTNFWAPTASCVDKSSHSPFQLCLRRHRGHRDMFADAEFTAWPSEWRRRSMRWSSLLGAAAHRKTPTSRCLTGKSTVSRTKPSRGSLAVT